MSLLSKARRDFRRHTTEPTGASEEITFVYQDGSVCIRGIAMIHHLGQDSEGNVTNTLNSHITFSEALANENGIKTQDENGKYAVLENQRVRFPDSTGVQRDFVVKQVFPDKTVGMIYCVLGVYARN